LVEPDLQRRIEALEEAVRQLSVEQIVAFNTAVGDAPPMATWPADERFWYSGTGGVGLTGPEKEALGHLWTRMLAGLAFVATGEEAYVARSTLMARLDRLVASRDRLIEGSATTVLEQKFGGEMWRGVIGIWNALCAALLAERLDSSLRSDLGFAWRHVMGHRLEL
jgi:hypothetical protein